MSLDDHKFFVEELHQIAPKLEALKTSRSQAFFYDAITEAIIWEDELPDSRESKLVWALRPIFRYRASLILGQPDARCEPYWRLASDLFPSWIGFRPERLHPAPEVVEFLRKKVTETEISIRRMMDKAKI